MFDIFPFIVIRLSVSKCFYFQRYGPDVVTDPEEAHHVVRILGHEVREGPDIDCLLVAMLVLILIGRLLFLGDTPGRQPESLVVN